MSVYTGLIKHIAPQGYSSSLLFEHHTLFTLNSVNFMKSENSQNVQYYIVQLNQQSYCKHIQFPNNTNVLCVIWQQTIDLIVNKEIYLRCSIVSTPQII